MVHAHRDAEIEQLRERLREAEETLQALRRGEIDALVIDGPEGPRVYALRTADHPYRILVEQMHEGAATLSSSGTILYANRRFAELVQVPLEHVIGTPFIDFVKKDARDQVACCLTSPPCRCEGFIIAPGRDVPVTISASAMAIEELHCLAVVVTDLTDQKRRDSLLEAEKLARIRLEDANRAKDEFLITVSHELRTPLTAILGWATLLRHHDLDAKTQQLAFDAIEKSTHAQVDLIEDLLDVSKIVTGKIRLKLGKVDIARLIDDSLVAIANSAADKHIRVLKEIDENLPAVRGDVARLQQVLWNLLTNALKFTPPGGTVTIRATIDESRIALSVSDTGCGISREFLPRMFDRFTQEDGSASRQYSGLGVGLSVSRDLVSLHGGAISAHSDGPGKGTTVTVTLPAFAPGTPEVAPAAFDAVAERPLTGLSILAVEDDPATRLWLVQTLELFGASVTSAATVAEALDVLDRHKADLVLSDIAMPTEDGLALIAKLRIREDSKSIPAIALTAYGRPEDCHTLLSAGFDHFVRKPIDAIDLVQTIHAIAAAHR